MVIEQTELQRLRGALDRARRMMQWCIDNGTDDATVARLRRGIEAIDRARCSEPDDARDAPYEKDSR